jgi:hypothetical protein
LNRDPNQIQIEKDKGTETMRRMKKETLNQWKKNGTEGNTNKKKKMLGTY